MDKLLEQLPTVVAELGYNKSFILKSAKELRTVDAQKEDMNENGNVPVNETQGRYRRVDDDVLSIASVDSAASL